MANNDDNPRRNRDRLEDNPFIAFRRFADSQVSSLLNTVFTLPATISNYNNVHQAREACLFKKAGKTQCEELESIEDHIAHIRHEGRELYRDGDVQAMLKKSEELMTLDRHADKLRKNIVEQSRGSEDDQHERELVHRVANKKGQEWGWDWSWGFPKPFDDENISSRPSQDEGADLSRIIQQGQAVFNHLDAEARRVFGNEAWTEATDTIVNELDSNPFVRAMLGDNVWKDMRGKFEEAKMRARAEEAKRGQDHSHTEHSSWFPAPADAAMCPDDKTKYSPSMLEADKDMQKAGVPWRKAYLDLVRGEQSNTVSTTSPGRSLFQTSSGSWSRRPWEGEDTSEEPCYEYSHDHEDQHDDPPTPKVKQDHFNSSREECLNEQHHLSQQEKYQLQLFLLEQENRRWLLDAREAEATATRSPEQDAGTELDAYEHALPTPKHDVPSHSASSHHSTTTETKPSILSTMTTTERTIAPDGSVTTKVVLKKRFADGREENSETVHTQRGHDMEKSRDLWQNVQQPAAPAPEQQDAKALQKKNGWFWSN
jgi:hypothetical protein